uniref:Sorting nexin-14-like n=1 Tax=Sinocyclocheilus anshuiensis TaxID=1608454 RepID=A0A671L118_9TELE
IMSDPHCILGCVRRGLRLHVFKDVARQYPVIFLAFICYRSTFSRYLHILMIFWLFLAGVITFYCSLSPEYLLPNVLISIKTERKPQKQQELFPLGHSCAVCGKNQCKRHRPTLLLENYQPWLDLKVPSKVDASISEVLELVLENFVYPWYRDITGDEACVDELRQTIRFFAAVLAHRAQRVDVPLVLMDKMMKAAMKHIEIIAKAQQKVKNTEGLQQAALAEYGADLHVALRSRKDELLYLRKLTELLFPCVMPPKATDCRYISHTHWSLLFKSLGSVRFFSPRLHLFERDTVNHMVLIFIDDNPPEPVTDPPSALVPFLEKFADPRNTKSSVLKLDLKEIREQQDLLFRFMSFLKEEGAVHVLQFCLTVEEFNDRILCPDLSDTEMQRLHEEVQKIYDTYCLEESIDKISFDPFIIEEIHNIKSVWQNLEPFIQSFFSSCESPKPKPSRPELAILSPTAENNKKLFNELYRNNANLPEGLERKHNQNYFMELMEVDGVYDFMMYIGRVVFHMPDWLHHFLSGARILLKRTLEVYVGHYFQFKLEQIMQEHCLVSLITLLRDAVFCESTEECSPEDKQRRAKHTFEEMMNYLPGLVGKCIGEEAKYEGVKMLFNTIQQPLLNKQMTYVLLDIAVQELFPELSEVTLSCTTHTVTQSSS